MFWLCVCTTMACRNAYNDRNVSPVLLVAWLAGVARCWINCYCVRVCLFMARVRCENIHVWRTQASYKKNRRAKAQGQKTNPLHLILGHLHIAENILIICCLLLCCVCIKSKQVLLTLLGWTGRRRCCLFGGSI